jgi:hypothetical protein
MVEPTSESTPGARAVATCEIEDVFLVEANCRVEREHIPGQEIKEFACQHSLTIEDRVLTQTRTLVYPSGAMVNVLRYFARGTVTILKPDSPVPETEEPPEDQVLAKLTHLFAVDYVCPPEFFQDHSAIGAFTKNAAYHAWSFWREAVLSDAARLRIPRVTIPMLKPKQSAKAADQAPQD